MRTPGEDVTISLRVRRANLRVLERGVSGSFDVIQLERQEERDFYALKVQGSPEALAQTPEPVDAEGMIEMDRDAIRSHLPDATPEQVARLAGLRSAWLDETSNRLGLGKRHRAWKRYKREVLKVKGV